LKLNLPVIKSITIYFPNLPLQSSIKCAIKKRKECSISFLPYTCCVRILRDQKAYVISGEKYCVKLVMGLNFHSANGHKNYHDNFYGILSESIFQFVDI
jgi:hypothetical protein